MEITGPKWGGLTSKQMFLPTQGSRRVHHPGLEDGLLRAAMEAFYLLRSVAGLAKPPSTSELIDWIQALLAGGIDPGTVAA